MIEAKHTWEAVGVNWRLVASDGEVLERVHWKHGTSEYRVESTGKTYVGSDAAKKAAEKHLGEPR